MLSNSADSNFIPYFFILLLRLLTASKKCVWLKIPTAILATGIFVIHLIPSFIKMTAHFPISGLNTTRTLQHSMQTVSKRLERCERRENKTGQTEQFYTNLMLAMAFTCFYGLRYASDFTNVFPCDSFRQIL